jgi:hypothetical protein
MAVSPADYNRDIGADKTSRAWPLAQWGGLVENAWRFGARSFNAKFGGMP